jgi:F1F0 ATPase subunit 2
MASMNETMALALAWLAGTALGAIFFGGLWWTVRKGLSSQLPAFWFAGSLLLRMTITLVGFYVVMGGQWQRLLACSLGFLMARLVVTWRTRLPDDNQSGQAKQASHAP